MQSIRSRRIVVVLLFLFLLFHQADKTIMAPLIKPIMGEFQINEAQIGAVSSLGVLVSSFLYPLWGYLYDRHSRSKLLALASLIWGLTTSLSAVAPSFRWFMVTRASTGIDDSSYPGLYSLLSDYFPPEKRGQIYGLMQMTGPFGYMLGILLASSIGRRLGWRNIFLITGGIGVLLSVLLYTGVKEKARGSTEPELEKVEKLGQVVINWQDVKDLRKNKSLLFLIIHGFVGLFTWNVLAFWLFHYLETERGYSPLGSLLVMLMVNVALVTGYLISGRIGDALFDENKRGRLILATAGTFLGGAALAGSFLIPISQSRSFLILLGTAGLFLAFVSPNVMATMHDITLPEVRSTAQAFRQLFMDAGAAAAPFVAGLIAVRTSIHKAILGTSLFSWIAGTTLILIVTIFVSEDIEKLRLSLKERAENSNL